MITKMTPPVGTTGIYTAKAPFDIPNTRVYVCNAIRSFTELEVDFRQVYKDYYEPFDIALSKYQEDSAAGARIVTLIAKNSSGELSDVIYIPDTYIASYPSSDVINYNRYILSVDMGLLPDYIDIDHLNTSISNLASDILGVPATVHTHTTDYDGVIDRATHDQKEAARLDAIDSRETDRAKYLQQVNANQELRQQNLLLSRFIKESGLV